VSSISALPGFPGRVTLTPAFAANLATPPSNCADTTGLSSFWSSSAQYSAYLLKMGAASFSIEWAPNAPPRLMYDPDGPVGTQPAVAVADNVERMQVRVGLVSLNLLNPNPVPAAPPLNPPSIIWFPDQPPTAAVTRPQIDKCTAAKAECQLDTNSDFVNFPDTTVAADIQIASNTMLGANPDSIMIAKLMRRARIVELDLTVRSARVDPTLIVPSGAGYAVDGAGNPLDGRNRRHFVMRVSLRNYGYAGS
jgi:hypothetical protein